MDKKFIYFLIFLIPFIIDVFDQDIFIFNKKKIVIKKEPQINIEEQIENKIKNTFDINITINNINDKSGVMRIALYNKSDGFPGSYSNALSSETRSIRNTNNINLTLLALDKGEYAIAVFNDKNSNSKLDTGIFGIPLEQYGFSNNPTINFKAPSFEDCKFLLEEDKSIIINLN